MTKTKRKCHFLRYGAVLLVLLFGVAGCGMQGDTSGGPGISAEHPGKTTKTEVTKRPETPGTLDVTTTPSGEDVPGTTAEPELPEKDAADAELLQQLENMTLAEKVGQMFLVRCPQDGVEGVLEYHVGGYVLFARDFEDETKDSVRNKIELYQESSKIPLLIAVDEEGGSVVRISKYPEFRERAFLAPRELYAEGGMERIAEDTKEKAELLLSLGVNVNLAPVCDISRNRDAFMYMRSFGGDAEETAGYVATVVQTAKESGLGSALKHFPGYGENADTHEGIVYDTRSYETYTESDFIPFSAGMEAGAGAVMVSHNIVQCMDAEMPASLSSEVHRILREELSFDGVILTDDLYMDAIQDFTGKEAAAVAAVLAGNDMLCCTDFEVQIPAVIDAVEDGRISEKQIDESVLRILKWKAELGIFE